MDKIFEQAVCDFYAENTKGELLIHNTYGEPDEMPLDVYFRTEEELSDLENYALELCQGQILDVGAGLGALSLVLQDHDKDVRALEISGKFCEIMLQRGVAKVTQGDFLQRTPSLSADTLLMMMNGFGLCGAIDRLPDLFRAIDRNLASGGQVIFDSSDLTYLYEGDEKPADRYFGEMDYRYEYDGNLGEWFKWLYIDSETLALQAAQHGFTLQKLFTEETGQYLGRLLRI